MPEAPKPASAATAQANKSVLSELPFEDMRDFLDVQKGFIATLADGMVRNDAGTVVWNLNDYDFLKTEQAPVTVNPSLWRMARLNLSNGLYKVVERVYQIRGLDLANMTIIEGETGLILVDPLTTAEVARAGLELYYAPTGRAARSEP
jgi:alkyl sulfatase BDS1-like metallo-beta-lactamase superfamily hydrolase